MRANVIGALLAFLHDIHWRRWLDIRLQSWLLAILVLCILLVLLGVIPGGRSAAIVIAVLALGLLLGQRWAQRQHYVHFRMDPQAVLSPTAGEPPLWPEDKLLLHATGRFGVEGRSASLSYLVAYYRTFESREHAIMARKTPDHRRLTGQFPPDYLGMWYLFIRPEDLTGIDAGYLWFGRKPRLGLRLRYLHATPKGKIAPAVAYLHFDAEADRQRVWADLQLDLGGPPRVPWRVESRE